MHVVLIVETNESGVIWNGFRFANATLDADHRVTTFLLGAGVEAPELHGDGVNVHGAMIKYRRNGGELLADGASMDRRDLEETDLRPRATMAELVSLIETADRTITIG